MGGNIPQARLVEWSLATFHTVLFFLAFVVLALVAGVLGSALASLNTLVGAGIFVLLWFATWWTGHRVLSGVALGLAERHTLTVRNWLMFLRGAVWGGIEGIVILLIALTTFLLVNLVGAAESLSPANLIELLIFEGFALVVGSPFAFVIGAIIGVLFVIIDLALLALARLIFSGIELASSAEPVG